MSTSAPANISLFAAIRSATAATVPEFSLAGKTLPAKVVSCYDGDTFQAVLPVEDKLWRFNCRMSGYDTPEMKPPKSKPGRDLEKARAIRAKQGLLSQVCSAVDMSRDLSNPELDALVAANTRVVELTCKEFDKYGRLLVSAVTTEGPTIAEWMIQKGYGYAYEGGTKDILFATTISTA